MKMLLLVGMGSFAGGILRYWLVQLIQSRVASTMPFGTLLVNVLGCFLIGLLFAISEKYYLHPDTRLLLSTGLLGGFTTFSAFSNETVGLIRLGNLGLAMGYVLSSVCVGLLATWLGYTLPRLLNH
jgi:fluoride exporter